MTRSETLYRGGGVAAFRVECDGGPPGFGAMERAPSFEVVVPRRGHFRWRRRAGTFDADLLAAQFLDRGEEYEVAHPPHVAGGVHAGDACFVIALPERTVAALAELAPARSLGDRPRFPFPQAPLDSRLEVTSRRLERALARRQLAPLEAEEAVVRFLAAACSPRDGTRRAALHSSRTARRRAAIAAAARELIHARFAERLTVDGIATAVGASTFHLCRAFRAATGETLHAFQTRLRLAEALRRLELGDRDLLALALDLGFCEHAHFTTVFRRAFGVPPSAWRSTE